MGTKLTPARYDGEHKALPDEPKFTLLARDPQAPALVEAWAAERQRLVIAGEKPAEDLGMVKEATHCAAAMREWRERNWKR